MSKQPATPLQRYARSKALQLSDWRNDVACKGDDAVLEWERVNGAELAILENYPRLVETLRPMIEGTAFITDAQVETARALLRELGEL